MNTLKIRAVLLLILSWPLATQAFEARFEHQHGETVLTRVPERVVSIGYSDQDDLLALGVRPVAVREWFGDRDKATWPWAYDLWGDFDPVVLPRGELDVERIAALEPDLIVAISAGIDHALYRQLSQIAPTLPQSADYPTWSMPWQARTRWIGRAVNREEAAEEAIAEVEQRFDDTRQAHPEWVGKQALSAYFWEGELGVYGSNDLRGQFLEELGLEVPARVNRMAGDRFYTEVSLENLDLLNVDAVIWLSEDDAQADAAQVPGRELMEFHREGREVYADGPLAGAFSFVSPLSLHYLFDHLVPKLAEVLADNEGEHP